ncbi:SAM-dependent methyltransferase [uncultured Sphingomonas sp.]|uniref:SAM-dependent methyltransferase n=1 Tax=uncultured Sphingomonas sp. TaxID=158754 RepID=UPI002624EFE8|nr:SAM-dependent methyltransferase [uncultured Sphingomonas sp.]
MAQKPKPVVSAECASFVPSTRPLTLPGSRAAHKDSRWAHICTALVALRARRRHAVRIVDADCACGTLLIEAARHARTLGFTAIEGRGIDGSPAMIGRARAAAARLHDSAIGLTFEVVDMIEALADEADVPADIVLWHGSRAGDDQPGLRESLAKAGDLIIADRDLPLNRVRAA